MKTWLVTPVWDETSGVAPVAMFRSSKEIENEHDARLAWMGILKELPGKEKEGMANVVDWAFSDLDDGNGGVVIHWLANLN